MATELKQKISDLEMLLIIGDAAHPPLFSPGHQKVLNQPAPALSIEEIATAHYEVKDCRNPVEWIPDNQPYMLIDNHLAFLESNA